LHIVMPHNGVDFAAPPGTPIYATAPGTIRMAGDGGPCGNMVQILHANGLVSAYCHMSRFGPVHTGQHVEGRKLIGYVGQTGRATGPHLHFAVKRGDVFLDPMSMKLDGVRVLPLALREEFERRREELDARLDGVALPAATFVDGGVEDGVESDTIFDQPP
jgi:murein DD-endopeptidase MepM/ murein hydrolase activator NlpD